MDKLIVVDIERSDTAQSVYWKHFRSSDIVIVQFPQDLSGSKKMLQLRKVYSKIIYKVYGPGKVIEELLKLI